jgi:hypothetical protein
MKPHRFDAISFVTGLVITLLGLVFLIPQTPVDIIDALTSLGGWFWPVLLLVIGIAILVPVFLPKEDVGELSPTTNGNGGLSALSKGEPTEQSEVEGGLTR